MWHKQGLLWHGAQVILLGLVMRRLKLNLPFTFQSHQNHSSFLHKTVGAALQSLQPVSVTSNKIVDYGYILGLYTVIVKI